MRGVLQEVHRIHVASIVLLLQSLLFRSTMFCCHQRVSTAPQVDSPTEMDGSKVYASTTQSGAPCWVREDAHGADTIVSAERGVQCALMV